MLKDVISIVICSISFDSDGGCAFFIYRRSLCLGVSIVRLYCCLFVRMFDADIFRSELRMSFLRLGRWYGVICDVSEAMCDLLSVIVMYICNARCCIGCLVLDSLFVWFLTHFLRGAEKDRSKSFAIYYSRRRRQEERFTPLMVFSYFVCITTYVIARCA